ncbi:MAG: universal stress protein [Acidobacteriota bacterium]|nr:universal stress protein [Acidobacteriota bacterium]
MFKKILVALDHSKADSVLLAHVRELARLMQSEILLLHVSTGWKAQWQRDLNLTDSDEMEEDRAYLKKLEDEIRIEGFTVSARHAAGKPAEEILKTVREAKCDLIAMASHGHRMLHDVIYGTTITHVRHAAEVPLFLVRRVK